MKKSQLRSSLLVVSALSVSIASQLQAAVITSTAAGIWEDPASWIGGVFPDTFVADSAVIDHAIVYDDLPVVDGDGGVTTPATPYTLIMGIAPGGLSVLNGNSITINGAGSLTQATLLHEIRIGEGGALGVGVMSLNGGGTFMSGTSVGVAVGSDLNNTGLGDGQLDINEGVFVMENFAGSAPLPAGPAGLGVGIEGSKGTINVGDGSLLGNDAILDLETNGNNIGIGVTNQIGSGAGNGKVFIKADGLLQYSTGDILVGDTTVGVGLLQVDGGLLGNGNLAKGDVTVGRGGGQGTFNVTGGTVNTASTLTLGQDAGSIGTANITGGSVIFGNNVYDDGAVVPQKLGATRVGRDGGTGTLTIGVGATWETGADETTNTKGLFIGTGSTGSTGTVSIDGGTMTQHGWAEFGGGAGNIGTLEVKNGGAYNHLENSRDMQVGINGGHGIIKVESGGVLKTNWWINIARGAGSQGEVTVDGGTSKIEMANGQLNVGENGIGTMDLKNGGTFQWSGGDTDSAVGRGAGSTGTLNINTGGKFNGMNNPAQTDPGLRTGLRLYLGFETDSSNGTLNMVDGTLSLLSFTPGNSGKATVNHTGGTINVGQWAEIGQDRNADVAEDLPNGIRGNAALYKISGTAILNAQQLIVGSRRKGRMEMTGGTINVGNNGTVTNAGWGDFSVGQFGTPDNSHGDGVLEQTGGTINSARDPQVGNQAGTFGEYNLSGTGLLNVTNGWIKVGNSGTGTMTVKNGGTITAGGWLTVGTDPGGVGVLNLNDATSTINLTGSVTPGNEQENSRLFVGRAGKGTLNQTEGTITVGGWSAIGLDAGSEGIYNLSGGKIQTLVVESNFDFSVGRGSPDVPNNRPGAKGTLTVSGTGHVALSTDALNGDVGQRNGARLIVGNDLGSDGTVTVEPGGLLEVRHLTVGQNGKGTMTQNGGTVNVNQWLKIGEGDSGGPTGDDELAPDLVTPAPGENKALYTLNDGIINTPELMIGEGRRGEMRVNGGEVNILNGGFGIGRWGPGWNGGANLHGEGKLAQTGGTINSNGQLTMAETAGGKALYELSGGTLNLGVGGNHNLVVGNAGTGTMNVTNSPMINGVNDFIVAPNGGSVGNVNLAFANATDIMRVNAWMYVGGGTGSVGNVTVTKGELLVSGQSRIGYNNGGGGMGTLTVDGSEAKFTGNDETFVGYESGTSNGTIDVKNGGTVNINHWLNVGRNGGTGKVTQDSGIFTVANEARFGVSFNAEAPGTGTLNLSGGTFTANGTTIFGSGGGTGTANITGGILNALSSVIVGGANGGTSFQITNYATADNVIDGGPEQAFSFTANYTTSNTQDNGDAGGPFGLGVQVANLPAGDNNDFAFVGLGNFAVATTGSYIFGNNTDDGSRLRLSINGGAFTEIITDNVLSGPHDAFSAPIALTLGDTIALDWMWFERGGGAEGETFYSRDGGPNALWQDSTQGLTLNPLGLGGVPVGQYSGTVYKGSFTVVTSNGAVNLNGGVLSTTFIEAGVGLASLKLAGGTIQARQDEPNFIRGFTNSGGHSAILLEGPGGTIDSNGFRVKIAAGGSVFSSVSDVSSIDGQAGAVLTIEGDAILALSDTDKVTLQTQVGDGVNGYLSIRVKEGGWLDSEVSQVLDNITIDNGGYFELSNLSSPPGAPALAADGDLGGGAASLAGSPIQGVPEPGTMGLLLVTALGLLGRPNRRKKS